RARVPVERRVRLPPRLPPSRQRGHVGGRGGGGDGRDAEVPGGRGRPRPGGVEQVGGARAVRPLRQGGAGGAPYVAEDQVAAAQRVGDHGARRGRGAGLVAEQHRRVVGEDV